MNNVSAPVRRSSRRRKHTTIVEADVKEEVVRDGTTMHAECADGDLHSGADANVDIDLEKPQDDTSKNMSKRPRDSSIEGANVTKMKQARKRGRGPESARTCSYCQKICSSTAGLKYHLDNFVCRPDALEKKLPANKSRKKRKSDQKPKKAAGGGTSSSKRFRGNVEDRTCPRCERIFGSDLALKYHVEHKVCQVNEKITGKWKKMNNWGYELLAPGSKYVTQFGVVEVVNDQRQTPENAKKKPDLRQYHIKRGKVEIQNEKVHRTISAKLLLRRERINKIYETGETTKNSVFHAYFGKNPSIGPPVDQTLKSFPLPQDPFMDPNYYPDRMVECVLIPDTRTRYFSGDIKNPVKWQDQEVTTHSPTRLYLQRQVLIEKFNGNIPTYTCEDCAQQFSSLPGMRYHCQKQVCLQNKLAMANKRSERQEEVLRLSKVVERIIPKKNDRRERQRRNRLSREKGIYPETLLSLGFQFLKDDVQEPLLDERQNISPSTDVEKLQLNTMEDPTPLVDFLRKKVNEDKLEYQRLAASQKHGSMYSEVFRALQYQSFPDASIAERTRTLRRRKTAKTKSPSKPLPPLIDIHALADEIDSGRYPSFNRNTEDNHSDLCIYCKEGGNLICCDFCTNVEHLACIRKRFTVKDPEPEDDFICHQCIGMLLSRRKRAEKRRLDKQLRDEQRIRQEALEEAKQNPGIKKGMEYPHMAEKAKKLNEMVELLHDSQVRLRQALATAKMNNVRRKALGCYFTRQK